MIQQIEKRENGLVIFEMKNEALTLRVTNLGCHILSIYAKDKNGLAEDVVLSYEDVEECSKDTSFMGACVGRVANRIKGGTFDLNGETYTLAINNGPNHLHGGLVSFNQKLFDYKIKEDTEDGTDTISFTYLSVDMEEGYPGNFTLTVDYTLKDNEIIMHYHAISDKDTLCNITNHSYFNLSAGKSQIYDHELKMNAHLVACADEYTCPNGEFLPVEGSPFDFLDFHTIGERINEDHIQLKNAAGYDHCFILSAKEDQAILKDPVSGRKLTISTTMPCAQVYTSNWLAGGVNGKHGAPYENRDGIAIETQYLPDSIHLEKNSPTILKKDTPWDSETILRFEVEA